MAPVRLDKRGWLLRDECLEADMVSQRLGLQNHAWIQMLKWWINRLHEFWVGDCSLQCTLQLRADGASLGCEHET